MKLRQLLEELVISFEDDKTLDYEILILTTDSDGNEDYTATQSIHLEHGESQIIIETDV